MLYYYAVSSVNANGQSADSAPVSTRPIASAPPRLDYNLSGSELKFAWPTDHIGWRLEAQTNSLDAGLGSNWFTISGAVGTNQMTIPIGAFSGIVFFRLAFP
jgi:hypothetical protein